MKPDDPTEALIARLLAAQKKRVEKLPEPPHEKDHDPWDVVFVQTASPTLIVLALPLRAIRWVRERRRKGRITAAMAGARWIGLRYRCGSSTHSRS